ncbi:MAG: DNA ligase D [Acidobacteriia bacterium]|nr:DNA ligase D [Terriglobia bacterium]
MPLDDYSRKRDFARTPEPKADTPLSVGNRFVVQRHAARRLHYDLRLQIGGALKSWAVPKGPTLDPKQKRLAVHVEDHPLEYGDFEGTIPAGNYGAGVVTVWDSGTYETLGEQAAEQQLERGDFKFQLHGSKLMGNFALVRIKSGKKDEWLLLKKPDFAAQDGWNAEDHLEPVRSRGADLSLVSGAKLAAMPERIEPMLATLASAVPEGGEWVYEIKWDGFRGLCFVTGGKLRIVSRNGHLLNRQFPELQPLPDSIAADTAIIDGEIVAFDADGRPSFSLMQQRTGFVAAESRSRTPVSLVAFDLLYLNGYDLRDVALSERLKLLRSVLRAGTHLRLSESFSGSGQRVLQAARDHGLEGVVAKRLDSKYESGRSRSWVKVKFVTQQEFVICGFTTGRRKPFSSLVLGYYDNGTLTWAGNVGTGFTDKLLAGIYPQLEKLASKRNPFPADEAIPDVTWVEPRLVCSVRYSGWGSDNHLRAPVFVGMRPDLDAKDSVRESAAVSSAAPVNDAKLLPPGKAEVTLEVGGRRLKFTNLNKVFYPADGYTKRDVINYYHDVAALLVPHLAGRPLSLKRYPNGIDSEYFFQKDAPASFASWLRTEKIAAEENAPAKRFVICDDEPALLYLANLGCIDQNPWFSRVGSLDCPDFIVLDLDPYHCGFDRIVESALLVRRKLGDLELEGYPKTTGGDGMHVYVPIAATYSYEQVRTFAEIVARLVIAERPELFTTPRTLTQREKGKVYFDYPQISWGKTISAPYVLRAHHKAPVATPLRWSEVRPGLSPLDFTLANVRARFQDLGDIFAPVLTNSQRLETAMQRLEKLFHTPR